jgi:hypothetical protein
MVVNPRKRINSAAVLQHSSNTTPTIFPWVELCITAIKQQHNSNRASTIGLQREFFLSARSRFIPSFRPKALTPD